MAAHNYSDSAEATTLAVDFDSDSHSTMTVAASVGYPTVPFYIAIKRGQSAQQILSVTAVASTVWTVTPISGSSATHLAGSPVEHVAPATHFDAVEDHLDAVVAHGATGAVVGTTNTQTLTNKTISGASNTLSSIAQSAVTGLTTDITNLRVKSYTGDATSAPTVTTTATDVPGATVTITTPVTNTVVLVTATFDVSASGAGDTFVGSLVVDGSTQAGTANTNQTGRSAVSQTWAITLSTAASHTLKLQVSKVGTANTVTINNPHTRIVVTGAGI